MPTKKLYFVNIQIERLFPWAWAFIYKTRHLTSFEFDWWKAVIALAENILSQWDLKYAIECWAYETALSFFIHK